jgi:radical SAM protein with 4Fe4S-binding SPASM domain
MNNSNNFDLKVGFYCNHNCVHCVVSASSELGNLSFDQIYHTIQKVPLENYITLTGGELTIRPDFLKICDLCKNHKGISLQTNGTGLTEDICKKLSKYNISVILTIHSSNRETYLKTAISPEPSFEKAINAAKLLVKYNIEFIWQIVVHKINAHTVIETFKFAKSLNIGTRIKLTYPDPDGNANKKELLFSYSELKNLIEDVCSEFFNSITFEGFPLCILRNFKPAIYRSQKNDECMGMDFSNNLNFVKYDMANRRTYVKACQNCFYKHRCAGIYKKYIEFFGESEFVPLDEIKDIQNNKNYMYPFFFLWVFTTRKCNRNCDYCKQGTPLEFSDSMKEENLRYILDECIKLHNKGIVKKFSFELSGGEPFLAFDMFSKVIPEYKRKYSNIFRFSSATNGTIFNTESIDWIKKYYDSRICFSMDSLTFSKPLNGISSSKLQLENIKKLQNKGIRISCITVFDNQTVNDMLDMAEFAIKNFCHWRIILSKPAKHKKEDILQMAQPVLKFLYENNYYQSEFDFDSWDLWNKKNVAGCPCGRKLLGIMPDLEVIPGNGEEIIKLGKFNADDFLSIINNPLNDYYKNDIRPSICSSCELKDECDGGCKMNHKIPEMLKERCEAIKELSHYVQLLKK